MERNNFVRHLAGAQRCGVSYGCGDSRGFLPAELLRVCRFAHGATTRLKCLTDGFTVLQYCVTDYEFGVDDIESGSP